MNERLGLLAPGLAVLSGGVADQVRRVDPELVTVFNTMTQRYEIYDRAAPGGPKWQLVMRVQEEDGSFRPLDGRVLEPLYQARGRDVMELLDEFEARDEQREQEFTKHARGLGEDLYEIVWALGKRVVPTVAWRDRTSPEAKTRMREKI